MRKREIVKGLKELGLKKGDIVLLHSALSTLGRVEGGANTVVDAFIEVLAKEGTLVVPVFGKLGVITEAVKARRNSVKSIHPTSSVAAVGARAKEICRDHWKAKTAHAEDTPYIRISDLGGYVCLLGVDQDRSTMLHTPEELLRLPYMTTQEYTFSTPEGEVTRSYEFLPGPHRNFIGLDHIFRERGVMNTGKIGDSVVRLMKAKDIIDICLELGQVDPAYSLCDNPNCADCIKQRAALRRDLFTRQSYRVLASTRLAGRYVPEIAENCAVAGIERVELDCVQGEPAHAMTPDRLAEVLDQLTAAGIPAHSIRLNAITPTTEDLIKTAAKAKVAKIVLPLSDECAQHAKLANQKKLAISFFNTIHSAERVSEITLKMKKKGLKMGLTFSPANFARTGQKPFLKSFHTKAKRFIDGLDVEDALFDGAQTRLARGNAEVKEMVSILSCASFSGTMNLSGGNREVAGLLETTDAFIDLVQ